jgi:hypothetical protein
VSAGAARLCGRCGRVRPISKRAGPDGPDICSSCWRPPTAVCTVCGRERPCNGVAAGHPVCSRCRTRSTSRCAHCGETRPATARWPEGPVCEPCYTAALRRTGSCAVCGRHRRLVTPPGPAATICGDCSGTGPAGHVCSGCGVEDKLFARGYCARCTLAHRTDELLSDRNGAVPIELAAVRDAIVATDNPLTALNWLRNGAGAPILAALARGDIALCHEALDAHPKRRAADYLRAMLVAHGALPPRDQPLVRLERAVADLLAEVPTDDDRRMLTAYATWRILHRARRRAQHRPTTTTIVRRATVYLRAAIALLEWLRTNNIRLDRLTQADIDQWLLTGPTTLRREVSDFLGWSAYRRLTPKLTVTRADSAAGPTTGEADYWRLAHRLLHDNDIATIDRVAGSFVLLYGQQLSRIAAMTRNQIQDRRDALSVRFGTADIEIPEPLAGFVRAHLDAPRRHASLAAPDSNWLFPGHLPARPITPARLGERLGRVGVDAPAGHRAAMLQLATTVPAAVLVDLLGIHTTTAADWAHASGGDWSSYAAEIVRARARSTDRPDEQISQQHSTTSINAVHQFQRRHRAARADGAHGPRHPGNDAALRQTRHADHPQCLPGGDGQGSCRATAPTDRRQRRAAGARQGRLAACRDAQNPTRARLLRTPQSRRTLPLRQHLRTVRLLRPRPSRHHDDQRATRRHPRSASRCRSPRLG